MKTAYPLVELPATINNFLRNHLLLTLNGRWTGFEPLTSRLRFFLSLVGLTRVWWKYKISAVRLPDTIATRRGFNSQRRLEKQRRHQWPEFRPSISVLPLPGDELRYRQEHALLSKSNKKRAILTVFFMTFRDFFAEFVSEDVDWQKSHIVPHTIT